MTCDIVVLVRYSRKENRMLNKRWWYELSVNSYWFILPTIVVAKDYEPPYVKGVVRRDPPDSLVVEFAWLNLRLKIGQKYK